MPKLNTTVKAVRIDNDKLAALEEKLGGRTINSWLNEQIECFVSDRPETENDAKGVNPSYLDEIEEMATLSGMTMDRFYESVAYLLNNGDLELTGDSIKRVYPKYMMDFVETCHDLCIPVEKAAESAIKALKRGGL